MNLWESKGIGETGKNASGFHPVKAAFWQQTLIHHALGSNQPQILQYDQRPLEIECTHAIVFL